LVFSRFAVLTVFIFSSEASQLLNEYENFKELNLEKLKEIGK
jgi:hypothetical protein